MKAVWSDKHLTLTGKLSHNNLLRTVRMTQDLKFEPGWPEAAKYWIFTCWPRCRNRKKQNCGMPGGLALHTAVTHTDAQLKHWKLKSDKCVVVYHEEASGWRTNVQRVVHQSENVRSKTPRSVLEGLIVKIISTCVWAWVSVCDVKDS